MNETSNPEEDHARHTGANAADDVVGRAGKAPGHAAFARQSGGTWRTVTAQEFADQVTGVAAGLVAAGISPGDRVAIVSATRYEWALCDYAVLMIGAVSVPLYETSSAPELEWMLRDSGAVAAFVEPGRCQATFADACAPSVRRSWAMDLPGLNQLCGAGTAAPAGEVERLRREVTSDSPATIVYTSGATGRPKGCTISHGNLISQVDEILAAGGIADEVLTEDASLLLFLPLAHVLTRLAQFAAVRAGTVVAHTSDFQSVAADLATFRPTAVLAVPQVFDKLYRTAARQAATAGHARVFRSAARIAIAHSRSLDTGGPGWWLRIRHRRFDRLVYRTVRAAMGGRATVAVSGGAPLPPSLAHFLRGAGIRVLEGYGLTETTGAVTLNLPAAARIGTVGRPLPHWSVRIAPDDEVLVRGPGVFTGYRHDEPGTKEVLDADGWLRTGDLGRLDDGYLTVTGRKKDLIVTTTGKNVAPGPIEDRLNAHPLIDHAVLAGDDRPYLTALVTLDPDAFADWKRDHAKRPDATVTDLCHDIDLVTAMRAAIDAATGDVPPAGAIKRFRIVPTRFEVGDELTPTRKIRRDHVLAKYSDQVEALYSVGS
ncbi:AMP-dependent synthetase/ligase [Amycolatopsis sp. CA-230715]|uniref:AMP-dependent synthetase/ligase n=1 Tax=Amycolatopsis sp. CA-230715 TaxID=2745196 RepID=UPI001C00DEF8|nr:long-chain fatty acid--CoA ligase [Amycolatopsis sp. CA-230715]QWF77941.1 Long-chain-fatty-acid--CoA ligase FadD15 [Amycolatopsis sp. CA-230715]